MGGGFSGSAVGQRLNPLGMKRGFPDQIKSGLSRTARKIADLAVVLIPSSGLRRVHHHAANGIGRHSETVMGDE
jgi:hypothetical protein